MKEFNNWHAFQAFAQSNGFDTVKFIAMMPSGPQKGRWLDAYFGLVKFDCLDGFVTVGQLDEIAPDAACLVLEDES